MARFFSLRLALLVSLASSGAQSQTFVSGPISADTTWTPANSPYITTGSILIGNGATLTIEPGVVVRLGEADSITVGAVAGGAGAIKSLGTEANPVLFTSDNETPTPGDWGFVLFADSAIDCQTDPETGDYLDGSVLRHTVLEFGGSGGTATGVVTVVDSDVYFDHVTFRDSSRPGVYADFTADLIGLTFRNCNFLRMVGEQAATQGLGLYIIDGRGHDISNCTFSECESGSRSAGAYFSSTDSLHMTDTTFANCTATDRYGAFSLDSCNLATLTDIEVSECSADNFAGAYINGNDIQAQRMAFDANFCTVANGDFAGLYAIGNRHTILDSVFTNNIGGSTLAADGGALFFGAHNSTISGCSFVGNRIGNVGGAMYMDSANSLITGCHFEDNKTVYNNTAIGGGAVYITRHNTVFEDCTFVHNDARGSGGAVHATTNGSGTTFRNCLFDGNICNGGGGAIYTRGDNNTVEGCTFLQNRAQHGGAIHITSEAASFDVAGDVFTGVYNEFVDNIASIRGPALFNGLAFQTDGSGDLNAGGNCWNTSNLQDAATQVYDFFDDSSLGIVVLTPLVPCTCIADVNTDGIVSPADFTAWVSAYYTGSFIADQNRDGQITPADFTAWIANYNAGCG